MSLFETNPANVFTMINISYHDLALKIAISYFMLLISGLIVLNVITKKRKFNAAIKYKIQNDLVDTHSNSHHSRNQS